MKCKNCRGEKKGTYKDVCWKCYKRLRYKKNPKIRESARLRQRKYQRKNKEKCKLAHQRWLKKNPHYFRDYQRKLRKIDPKDYRKKISLIN